MRSAARAGLLWAVALSAAEPVRAQANPRGEAVLELDGHEIRVDYGRPSLRGRDMIALAQPGDTWRLGADAPTRLFTSAPLRFGRTRVGPGEHVLRARREAHEKWMLLMVDEEEQVREVPMTGSASRSSVETFTIELKKTGPREARLAASWGSQVLSASFSLD